MFSFNKESILKNIERLKSPRVLIIGDLAIDEMVYGETQRISREAPVLILLHNKTNIILGGGSNAANNAASINKGKVSVIGVVGQDYHSNVLKEAFDKSGISHKYLVEDAERYTTVKTRISGSCSHSVTQQIVRIDRQTSLEISTETENEIIKNLQKAIPEHDAIILSDYHLGVLTKRVINEAVKLAKQYNKLICVDAQKDFENYNSVTALTPNQPDLEKFIGYKIQDEKTLHKAIDEILTKTNAEMILLTRGDKGLVLAGKNGDFLDVPVFNKKAVFDVTGAGDTVVAVFVLALAAGLSSQEAAILGNVAASIVIKSFGCATTTISEIVENIKNIDLEKFTIGG